MTGELFSLSKVLAESLLLLLLIFVVLLAEIERLNLIVLTCFNCLVLLMFYEQVTH